MDEVKRSVNIIGVPARLIVRPWLVGPREEYRSVQDAADLDRERGDPADVNHCPLCNDYFGPEAFARHAQSCINANAPRWERNRDTEPVYAGDGGRTDNGGDQKRFRPKLFGPTGDAL